MRFGLIALMVWVWAGVANACPDFQLWGNERYDLTAQQLYSPQGFRVVAGGNNNLAACRIKARNFRGAMPGYVTTAPDFSMTVRGRSGFQLEFRVVSNCDATLLINTASGNWYFDDDDNGNADPKIRLTRPAADGIYDVWIGTFDGSSCDAVLYMETF
ncbi:hypothetical protein ACFFUT_16220 [Pseudohalocynthiibacter aestuariivivens]|uniref:Peptidase S1 n=1 Tax=Pseudohalocynthiibacter aestuariivivens TaxID=1591409 RepID=A0ABV5JIQ0_9RHOB|nr:MULTISPECIES: hypothetical protein [Pseudohalocynthiibacter]MBS9716568.1 hypothetical protein [Pseudohalocynthiibacter aestuariivivens]MCK0101638.1 hypothetical protein [Pseudohalocynthiibacter sp. F2068]